MKKFNLVKDTTQLAALMMKALTGKDLNITECKSNIKAVDNFIIQAQGRANQRGITAEDEILFELLKEAAKVRYSTLKELDHELAAANWLKYSNANVLKYKDDFPGQPQIVWKMAALTDWKPGA